MNNTHPIILVHGFMGWGRDEVNQYYYWGGDVDFQDYFTNHNFIVHTASVGPISSNWDRAIELYTQIKGGCIDYGHHHSMKFGIIQEPGICYDGIYPEWDSEHPIHIVGHSQGGLTARMLEYLLITNFDDEPSKLLSENHFSWIHSITTISSPHNGTTLSDIMYAYFPFTQKLTSIAGLIGNYFTSYYNFDLYQWNLDKIDSESYYNYFLRLSDSGIMDSENFSVWDLSARGARQLNDLITSVPSTYYFSYATYTTQINGMGNHVPNPTTSPALWASSLVIGRNNKSEMDSYQNDGLVNTSSMYGPYYNYISYNGFPRKGVWQLIDTLGYDHHQIVGRGKLQSEEPGNILILYINHFNILYNL